MNDMRKRGRWQRICAGDSRRFFPPQHTDNGIAELEIKLPAALLVKMGTGRAELKILQPTTLLSPCEASIRERERERECVSVKKKQQSFENRS